jgi:surface antigen
MNTQIFTRRRALTLAAAAGAAAAVGLPRAAYAGHGTNTLRAGESLGTNQYLRSSNGSHTAVMQADGNFVLYSPGAKWSTRTAGKNGSSITMQGDGNLVVSKSGVVHWHTGTAGYTGASLVLQDDGNLVMYRGAAIWATSWHWVWGNTQARNPNAQQDCSWYAYEAFKGFSGVYPNLSVGGHAHTWNETAVAQGWLVINEPKTQAVVCFERSVAGASATTGHLAWVDFMQIRSDNTTWVHVFEMNFGGGIGILHQRWVQHRAGMSYIMAPQR